MKVKTKRKPIKKTTKIKLCPNCGNELQKVRPGYHCLICGYSYVRGKKSALAIAKDKCDDLWRWIIKSGGNCEICGKPTRDPHHVVGKKNLALRWDIRNGVRLCFQHHTGGKLSAHNDPIWFMDWFLRARPDDYKYLLKKKNEVWDKDYEKVLEYLEKIKLISRL